MGGESQRLRIEVLGPLRAWRDGGPLALGPVRRQTVLAALLIRDWLAAEEKARRMEAMKPTAVTGDAAEPRKRDTGSTRDS